MFFLLLAAVSTPWCAADCVAQALTPATCHHEDAPKVCDDPSTVVPDAALGPVHFDAQPLLAIAVPILVSPTFRPYGANPPRPPLRL